MSVLVTGAGPVTVPDTAFNDWVSFLWILMLFVAVFLMMLYGNRKDAIAHTIPKGAEGEA